MRSLGRGFVLVLVGAFLFGVYKTHAPGARAGATLDAPTRTDPVVKAHRSQKPPKLVSVRTSRHGIYDRVVFTFAGPLPASRTGYVRNVRTTGSDKPVPLDGFADLQVSFDALSRDRSGRLTWPGPATIHPRYPSLRQVTLAGTGTGDGERTVFGLGVDHRVGFRVIEVDKPSGIAIDVAS
ncbi:MAG TPA: hypothetical protein VG276_01830 [Actinomycetes bacterium]|nr:hypothetical protein [Actinomycetes bacterium]